jgi:hypothetical protein
MKIRASAKSIKMASVCGIVKRKAHAQDYRRRGIFLDYELELGK